MTSHHDSSEVIIKNVHIHSSLATQLGRIPFLVLGIAESGRLSFDFSQMDRDTDRITPSFALSTEALYEVLQGNQISIHRRDDEIQMQPREEELVIQCTHAGRMREYRVWLAELAVGWNMLARADGAWAA